MMHPCLGCGATTHHRHLHDCAHGIPETHLSGTERFECAACGRATFAYSDDANTFRFVLDGPEREQAPTHALARR